MRTRWGEVLGTTATERVTKYYKKTIKHLAPQNPVPPRSADRPLPADASKYRVEVREKLQQQKRAE
eukprot:15599745-Heterocapsa_arctica.AAC.1